VWDLTNAYSIELCYDEFVADEACNGCIDSYPIDLCYSEESSDLSCNGCDNPDSYPIDLCYNIESGEYACDCNNTPDCSDRRVVLQICNFNAAKDDNFDIYLNGTYIGAVDLSQDAQVGSVFIADTDTSVGLISSDFACPLSNMVTYHFNPNLLSGSNVLEMRNTQTNNNGNFGTVGIRNYQISGNSLSNPCVIANLEYMGPDGASFTMNFDYTQCCAD
jgi:hypothetical protein